MLIYEYADVNNTSLEDKKYNINGNTMLFNFYKYKA